MIKISRWLTGSFSRVQGARESQRQWAMKGAGLPHREILGATSAHWLRRNGAESPFAGTRYRIEPAYCALLDAALVDLRSYCQIKSELLHF
jgi:hypothetical protein